MRSHAKAPTAGSTQRQANCLGRTRFAQTVVFAFAIAALMACAATPASASLQRSHEGSFATFTGSDPQALTVDQSNGDVYVISVNQDKVFRFDSSGSPKNFTAGPDAGTNALTGLNFESFSSLAQVAVDNSGGPSDGNIYVTQSTSGQVKIFSTDGEPLGSLNGSGTPAGNFGEDCGAAVDQANGDLYVASFGNRIWRYSPSGATVTEGEYSGGIATSINPCQLAVSQGSLYAQEWKEGSPVGFGPVRTYATSEFATGAPPSPSSTQLVGKAGSIAADPSNGDVYVDEGNKVSVFSSTGTLKYSFGVGDFGSESAGVGIRIGGEAYVADPTANEIDLYGTTLEPGGRASLFSFATFTGSDPQALTVDQSNGDVYVISVSADKVLRFDSSGAPRDFTVGPDAGTNALSGLSFENFSAFAQVALDNSGGPSDGNIYVTQSSGQVKVFAESGEPLGALTGVGTPAGGFGEACGAAIDQSNGDLYVASWTNRIWRYSPSTAAVAEADYSGGIGTSINPCQLAVASGSLYAQEWRELSPVGFGPVRKYETSAFATGAPPSPASSEVAAKAGSIATDPSNGDLYVDEGSKVSVYGSAGSLKYSFGSADFGSESAGVGVKANGNAYLSDPTNHQIDVYGPFSAPPPIVETVAATGVKHVKATLHGHLDPNNSLSITNCVFEWGTDTTYGNSIPCAEGASFNAAADVSAELAGLTPGATYHFRLHVTTGSGGFDGGDQSFETVPASSVPEVVTGKGTIVSSSSSEVSGTVNPNANPLTDCRFEYVTDLALQATGFSNLSSGGSVPCDQTPGSIAADFEDHEVTATLAGLDPEQVYRFRLVAENANGAGNGEDALLPGPPLVETTGSTWRTTTTARLDSRVSPHGAAATYHFEYVTDAQFQANGFAGAISTPDESIVTNEVQVLTVTGNGGESGAHWFKLSFGGYTSPELPFEATAAEMQSALRALPSIGSPNVKVAGEVGGVTRYQVAFQAALANTDVAQIEILPGTAGTGLPISFAVDTLVDGGPGSAFALVSAQLTGLQSATTYHYRVVADDGSPDAPVVGDGMTLATRASDGQLSHGPFPGPPGSDRAWEQVSEPDTGGSPVFEALAISDKGDRAVYKITGGSPGSEVGYINQLFAERTPTGWRASRLYPTRTEAPGNAWDVPLGRSDLSPLFALNYDSTRSGIATIWRLLPGSAAELAYSLPANSFPGIQVSEDGSRVLLAAGSAAGNLDPDHPAAVPLGALYDLSSGTPHLVGLLPDGSVPSCGLKLEADRAGHWLSADGSHVFFLSGGNVPCGSYGLYVRDLEAETTRQISSSASQVAVIRFTSDAAFFATNDSLVPEDEGGRDVYRYDLDAESLDCLTCFPGIVTDVAGLDNFEIAVSEDGSRLYFTSPHRLLPGAASPGLYRLDVASKSLAYVAPVNRNPADFTGQLAKRGNAINPDGSVFVFRSAAPGLNWLNGPQNGGTAQYYLYDDDDRSLVCVSCPADGSAPRGSVDSSFGGGSLEAGPNLSPMSNTGDLAFPTPTALVSADQNTAGPAQLRVAGTDIYEWRDGRPLLVTDGLTTTGARGVEGAFQAKPPAVAGVTPSGNDVFFIQGAQLTPDAIDSFGRLYDARIGGGFEFPAPPPPCSLEACQGTPKGAPEESRPSSLDFSGSGNTSKSPPARCRRGKVRRRGRCVSRSHKAKHHKHTQNRTNNDRRAGR